MEKYIVLGQLLGCYFHQDWPEEFRDSNEVICEIISHETHEKLLAAVSELDQLIELKLSEKGYRELMTVEVGCFFEPESEELTYLKWLMSIRADFLGR